MAINTSVLNSSFDISGIERIDDVDTRQLIRKDVSDIRVSNNVDGSDIPIAYLYLPAKDIADNISIIDKSYLMSENSLSRSISTLNIVFSGPTYDDIVSTRFLVSDVFTDATPTKPAEPLYLVHKVPGSYNGSEVVDCDILDKNYIPVNANLFSKDLSVDSLYTNLRNTYDEVSGDLELYYARYIMDDSTSVDVILNSETIYAEAGFDDIDTFGNIKQGVKKYILSYDTSGGYSLTLPRTVSYAIKYDSGSAISLLYPKAGSLDRIWFVRVINGDFIKNIDSTLYRYNMPEFSDQLFSPYEPYRFAAEQECDILVGGVIKTPDSSLRIHAGESLHVDVVIKDENYNIVYATSTISSKDGGQFIDSEGAHNVEWDNALIHSFDEKGGFIKLNAQLKFSYKATATYYYAEDSYEMTSLNINPISNFGSSDYKYMFYIIPEGPTNPDREKALYYVQVDDIGKIVYCSQRGGDGNVDLATSIEGILDYDKGADNFIERYTTAGADTQSTHYLLLGEVSTTDAYKNDDLSSIDIRLKGGGLREDYDIEHAAEDHPEIKWFEDIGHWDGQPHNTSSMVLVKLPYTILTDYGGTFEKEEVQKIAERHVALGTYVAVRYYGNVADVLSFIPGDTVIDLSWSDLGASYTYDVYVGSSRNGTFTKHNVSPISAESYSVDSLINNRTYYVYVTATNGSTTYPKSETWSAIPFA